jgi:quercetin dioxygenase-like cupin family protein
MKIMALLTGDDGMSHFKTIEMGVESTQLLGDYSGKYAATALMFREFKKGANFDWHTAPQPQYIIYLEGKVEVEASSGEKYIFKQGDVLFANDLTGKGHITRTLTDGRSVIVTTKNESDQPIDLSKKCKL